MTLEDFKKTDLPDQPGVYFFIGLNKEILYIGKATSLRDRVRSYFAPDLIATRGRMLVDMVTTAKSIRHLKTDSVLEALLLEANLIKIHQPYYNTKEKDNKSYNYVVFTDEAFPRVFTMRGRTMLPQQDSYKYIFGPFPHGAQLKEAMKIIRRIFPYADKKCVSAAEQIAAGKTPRPCFNKQLGLCPGVCTGEITQKEYAEEISNLKLFFEGKKKALLKNLKQQMDEQAKAQEFEKAAVTRSTIFALGHIQDIALLKHEHKIDVTSSGGEFAFTERQHVFRIEAYDVSHSSGKHVVGVMVVVEDGEIKKSDYRKFKIKINPGVDDTAALKEIVRRRLGHLEWPLPSLVVVDGAVAQLNSAAAALKERGLSIPLVAVVKDERHKPREILGDEKIVGSHGRDIILANSESHRFALAYHRSRRDRLVP